MGQEYDKLVRDGIPEIIESNGETAVVHAIREHRDVSREELVRLRAEKIEKRGRFAERLVLERVE